MTSKSALAFCIAAAVLCPHRWRSPRRVRHSAPYCRWYSTGKADVTIASTAITGRLIHRLRPEATTQLLFVRANLRVCRGSGALRKSGSSSGKARAHAKRDESKMPH